MRCGLQGMVLMLVSAAACASPCVSEAETRRAYVDSRFGQLHLHHAAPMGEPTAPALILLHQTPLSGRMYSEVLPCLAQGRNVYALDTPGYGESDPPPAPADIEAYAAAIADFLASLQGPVDLLGYHTGVLIATELAVSDPQKVRALVLVAVPLLSDEQRAAYRPEPTAFAEDGSHLLEMWRSSWRVRPPGQSIEQVARIVAEKQRAGERTWWAGPAIYGYPLAETLPRLGQPVLMIRPADALWDHTARAAALTPHATLVDRDDWQYGFFDAAPHEFSRLVLDYLDDLPDSMDQQRISQ